MVFPGHTHLLFYNRILEKILSETIKYYNKALLFDM